MLVHGVAMADAERLERRPGLPAFRHVLPLFLADDALRGRVRAFRILRAAGGADEMGHDSFRFFETRATAFTRVFDALDTRLPNERG
jgi:hypothetical protein